MNVNRLVANSPIAIESPGNVHTEYTNYPPTTATAADFFRHVKTRYLLCSFHYNNYGA
jgi:hypothetical protein